MKQHHTTGLAWNPKGGAPARAPQAAQGTPPLVQAYGANREPLWSPHRFKIDENRTPRHPRDWRDAPRGTLGEHLGDPGPPWKTPWEPRPRKVAKRWFADPPRDPPGGAILRHVLEKVEKEPRRDCFCRAPGPICFFAASRNEF